MTLEYRNGCDDRVRIWRGRFTTFARYCCIPAGFLGLAFAVAACVVCYRSGYNSGYIDGVNGQAENIRANADMLKRVRGEE